MAKKQEQHSIQIGRTKDGMVVVGKDNEPIIFMKAPEALMMAAELLKHAAIVTSGATMVADAIERAQ
jgi:hypothetical protein